MTNKELAAQCLIEAAELLNEGAKYRKELKDSMGMSSYDYGKEASRRYAGYGFKDSADFYKTMGQITAMSNTGRLNKEMKKEYNILFDKWQKGTITPDEKSKMRKIAKSGKLNRKINERASNNESINIASLLREAADLLDE